MQRNTVKEKLKAGQCVYGTSLRACFDPEIAPVLGAAGLDFFFVDTEHSPATYPEIQALCRSARAVGVVPLVRVTDNQPHLISRALDVGAMGVIVPRVNSPQAARAAVGVAKFPPLGRRGFGLGSVITDYHDRPAAEEIESCNRETMVVVQIESKEALDYVEEIASLEGLDVLFIGPYDLSLSLGIIEQFDNPIFWEAVDRVVAACDKAGLTAGVQSGDMAFLRETQRRRVRFLMYSSDARVLLSAYKQSIRALKETEVPQRQRASGRAS